MKVLLYSESLDKIGKSGLGKSIRHQQRALELEGIEYTMDTEDDFDVLHINTYFAKSYFFAKKCREQGKAVVFHAHSTKEDFENSFILSNQVAPLFKKWLQICYRTGDILITPTPYSKRLLDTYKLNREIVAISNGIELKKFAPIENAREKFCEKYGYQKSDKIVMGIGLYLERKGILDFVELAKRMPDVQFIWFGYTKLATVPSEIRKAVETELPNLNFTGYVPNEDIILALQGTDLYIFPTLEETEGIPAIEACAAKADFIVRDIPVFDGWLEDGVNVYKAKDVDAFEQKIRDFLDGKLPSLVEAAYPVAEERDLKNIGKELRKVYERALVLREERVKAEDEADQVSFAELMADFMEKLPGMGENKEEEEMSTPQERMEKASAQYHAVKEENKKIREALELLQKASANLKPLSDYYFDNWMDDVVALEETDFQNDVMNQDAIYEEIAEQYDLMKQIVLVGAQYINAVDEAE